MGLIRKIKKANRAGCGKALSGAPDTAKQKVANQPQLVCSQLHLLSHALNQFDHVPLNQPSWVLVKSRSYLTSTWEIQKKLVSWTQPHTPDPQCPNNLGSPKSETAGSPDYLSALPNARPFWNFPFGDCFQGLVTVGSENSKCVYLPLLWLSQLCWWWWGHKHDLVVPNDRHS